MHAYEAMCSVHVYQSSLVIDKIPQFFNLGALGTLVAAVERVRLNCVHVPVVHPRWQKHNRAISVLPSLPSSETGRAWPIEIEFGLVV